MIITSILILAVSAALGLLILINWLKKQNAPKSIVYSHGIIAVAGVVTLLIYAIQNPNRFPMISIILFTIAAIAGLYMFIMDIQKNSKPLGLAVIHAMVAIAGFLMLLMFAFS
ncbi:MAG: hypothetical protein ACK40G_00505 [Cytophagaceae bacterium]